MKSSSFLSNFQFWKKIKAEGLDLVNTGDDQVLGCVYHQELLNEECVVHWRILLMQNLRIVFPQVWSFHSHSLS